MLDGAEPMPGARELLEDLHSRGVACGVFTNKHGPSARAVCAHLGLAPYLDLILGATDKRAPQGFAPLAIGLGLTLIHLISIPVTNTSVNPARSTAVALFVGGWALAQLWLFWVAPIVGGVLGAIVYRFIGQPEKQGSPTAG